jgi:hypothetical protein
MPNEVHMPLFLVKKIYLLNSHVLQLDLHQLLAATHYPQNKIHLQLYDNALSAVR